MSTLPTLYIPHGGGPWPWVPEMAAGHGEMRAYLESIGVAYPTPRAVVLVSAHWEEIQPTVVSSATPALLYDYYGFPEHTYSIRWPTPGAPEVAQRVSELLREAGFQPSTDSIRGLDHGCFVPLALAYPAANIPTLQLSLIRGLDPLRHLRMGAALTPLRDEGVLIIASGMSYHNMRGFDLRARGRLANPDSEAFDRWLAETVGLVGDERAGALATWSRAPSARASHPREEHLIPLHVAAGAAPDAVGRVVYRDVILGARVSAVEFAG